jgi:hypothetical protein
VTCPQLLSIGAYTLGTLEPDDHARVAEHAQGCTTCAAAAREFALLPAMLDRVSVDDITAVRPAPSESAYRRLAASAAARRRDRWRRWTGAAAVVTLVALASAVVLVRVEEHHSGPTAVAASAGAVRAHATVEAVATGSRLTLRLSGVPGEQRCRLIAVARDGHRETAASWRATYEGTATINGTTGSPAATIASLVVESNDGRELVRLMLPTARG